MAREDSLAELAVRAAAPAERAEAAGLDDFEGLVGAHRLRVFRVLYGMLRDQDAAESLTQDCFLKAYQSRDSFRGECAPGTWLVRIAVNLARDYLRNRRLAFWRRLARTASDVTGAQQVADAQATPERQLAARQELEVVWAAAEKLSTQQRAVFLLRFSEEMSLEEIATATGLSLGTVKTHLSRAVGAIRKCMKQRTTR